MILKISIVLGILIALFGIYVLTISLIGDIKFKRSKWKPRSGYVGEDFVETAEYNYRYKKGTIDFSKEAKEGKEILKKSKDK